MRVPVSGVEEVVSSVGVRENAVEPGKSLIVVYVDCPRICET